MPEMPSFPLDDVQAAQTIVKRGCAALSAWLSHPHCEAYDGDYATALADIVADLLVVAALLGEFPQEVISRAQMYIDGQITDELVMAPSSAELLEVKEKLDRHSGPEDWCPKCRQSQ